MFIGEYQHTIDAKGRLSVPYRFRKYLQKGTVVAKGLAERYLAVYPKEEWDKLATKLLALPISDPKARAFTRLIFAGAMEVGFDRQGRVLLSNYLRDYAGLKNQAIIAGLYTRLEIWDARAWETYQKKVKESEAEISKHLEVLGI